MTSEHGQEPENDARTGENGAADGQTTEADVDRIVAVDVERLGGPEHENGEEVGSAHEGDDQRQGEHTGVLAETLGEHGVLRVAFPDHKGDQHDGAQEEGNQGMRARPGVLVATPLHAGHEQNHADDAEESAYVVDLGQDLLPGHAAAVYTRRRVVEDGGHDESDERPQTAEQADPAPRGVESDQLAVKDRGDERDDGEDQDGHVFATLGGRGEFRSDGQRGEFVDTSTDTCENHAADESVHLVCGRADDHAEHDEACSDNGHISSSDQIADASHEWADCRQRQEVCQDEPNPTINTANVRVDVGRNATEEIDGDLAAGPHWIRMLANRNTSHSLALGDRDHSRNAMATKLIILENVMGGSWSWSKSSPYVRMPFFS